MQPTKTAKGCLVWLKEIAIWLLLAIIISWAVDLWRSQSMASGGAPALVTNAVSGEQIDLYAMSQEKPVMLYFWATWCGICNSVSPSADLIGDYYQVVTIALTSGNEKRIQQYLDAKQYKFTVINDPQAEISRAWGVAVTPTIFIIDKGEIRAVTTGFTSPIGMWLRLLLA